MQVICIVHLCHHIHGRDFHRHARAQHKLLTKEKKTACAVLVPRRSSSLLPRRPTTLNKALDTVAGIRPSRKYPTSHCHAYPFINEILPQLMFLLHVMSYNKCMAVWASEILTKRKFGPHCWNAVGRQETLVRSLANATCPNRLVGIFCSIWGEIFPEIV